MNAREGSIAAAPAAVEHAQHLLALQQDAWRADMTPSHTIRVDRLRRVKQMTEERAEEIIAAIAQDFGHRARQESQMAEIMMTLTAAKHAMRHVKRWMRPKRVPTALQYRPAHNRLLSQPLGVVGIVAPWNYPYQLCMAPAIGALAAGNRVMLKPSEHCPAFSALLEDLMGRYFSPAELAVVTGGAEVAVAFSGLPFDHLVFTGSTAVGRQVAQAAARNLTPVTLELGGKSPVIVDESCDLRQAAPRLVLGKLFNAGQTCVAPDYAFVPRHKMEEFVQALQGAAAAMYPDCLNNRDYTSIVNARHFARLQALLDDAHSKGARIIPLCQGAQADTGAHRMAPALVLDVRADMAIMQEEIFGPLLPVLAYQDPHEALDYIAQHERPLALYWFGSDSARRDAVLANSIAGGVTINDCLWHVGQEDQPFGGVGASGTGAYHGAHGYARFSKEKPVFHQSRWTGMPLLYPPYGKTFAWISKLLAKVS